MWSWSWDRGVWASVSQPTQAVVAKIKDRRSLLPGVQPGLMPHTEGGDFLFRYSPIALGRVRQVRRTGRSEITSPHDLIAAEAAYTLVKSLMLGLITVHN